MSTKNIKDYPTNEWTDLIVFTHKYCLLRGNYSISTYIKKKGLNGSLRYWLNQHAVNKLLRATIGLYLPDDHFYNQMNISQKNKLIKISMCVMRHRGDLLKVADTLDLSVSGVRYHAPRPRLRWAMARIMSISGDHAFLIEGSRLC